MADTVVLAELTIDTRGVVTGVTQATGAIAGFDRKLVEVGDQAKKARTPVELLTDRMFSLRHAAIALVGSFSLAGVIFEFKNLAIALLEADPAFEELKKSAAGLGSELQRLAGSALGVRGGIEEVTIWSDRFTAAIQALRQAEEDHPAVAAAGRQGLLSAIMFGIPGVSGFVSAFEAAGAAMDALFKKQLEQIKASRAITGHGGPSTMEEWASSALFKEIDAQNLLLEKGATFGTLAAGFKLVDIPGEGMRIIEIAKRLGDTLFEDVRAVEEFVPPFEVVRGETEKWVDSLTEAGSILEKDIGGQGVKAVTTLKDLFKDLSDSMQPAVEQFNIIMAATQEFASQVATAITKGGVTFRSFAADMLTMVGQILLAWGALAVITTYFTGEPGFHVAAAAIAAGVGALVAARAFGGGREQQRGGSETGQPGTGGRALTVQFMGPTFGFNEQMFARYLADAQRRGQGSNA